MSEKKSGVDSLIDALKASGANVDGSDDKGADSTSSAKNASDTGNTNQQQGSGDMGGLGDIPKAILDLPIVEKAKSMSKKGS